MRGDVADDDPGLAGVRPFRFRCQRSGRCCTAGDGYVWVEDRELAGLAAARGLEVDAFRTRFVRTVPDPRTGAHRLALRERVEHGAEGRCALLEGSNECSVYAARPDHCRRFPYWSSVLEDEEAFERARAVCPGIEPVVPAAARAAAFAALEALYGELETIVARSQSVCLARGVCCRFEEAGHDLFATALEADFAAHRHPDAPPPAAPGRCPYHVGGRCSARAGRPLGCRTYFCDPQTHDAMQTVHEALLRRIRSIAAEHGYAPKYAPFPALLAARGIGAAPVDGEDVPCAD